MSIVKLKKEQFIEAESVAYLVKDVMKRKLVFANTCMLFAFKNYIEKAKYKFEPVTNINLFRVPAVAERYEISDLYLDNIRVDVRTSFDGKVFSLPKKHIQDGLAADFYVVYKGTNNPLKFEAIGYIKKEDLAFDSHDNDYYYISNSILNPIDDMKKEIAAYEKPENTFYETEHRISSENFGAFLDGELDEVKSLDLIKHLIDCADCRGKFVEYSFLEDVLTSIQHYPDLKTGFENVMEQYEPKAEEDLQEQAPQNEQPVSADLSEAVTNMAETAAAMGAMQSIEMPTIETSSKSLDLNSAATLSYETADTTEVETEISPFDDPFNSSIDETIDLDDLIQVEDITDDNTQLFDDAQGEQTPLLDIPDEPQEETTELPPPVELFAQQEDMEEAREAEIINNSSYDDETVVDLSGAKLNEDEQETDEYSIMENQPPVYEEEIIPQEGVFDDDTTVSADAVFADEETSIMDGFDMEEQGAINEALFGDGDSAVLDKVLSYDEEQAETQTIPEEQSETQKDEPDSAIELDSDEDANEELPNPFEETKEDEVEFKESLLPDEVSENSRISDIQIQGSVFDEEGVEPSLDITSDDETVQFNDEINYSADSLDAVDLSEDYSTSEEIKNIFSDENLEIHPEAKENLQKDPELQKMLGYPAQNNDEAAKAQAEEAVEPQTEAVTEQSAEAQTEAEQENYIPSDAVASDDEDGEAPTWNEVFATPPTPPTPSPEPIEQGEEPQDAEWEEGQELQGGVTDEQTLVEAPEIDTLFDGANYKEKEEPVVFEEYQNQDINEELILNSGVEHSGQKKSSVVILSSIVILSLVLGGWMFLNKANNNNIGLFSKDDSKVPSAQANDADKDMNRVMADAFTDGQTTLTVSKIEWRKSKDVELTDNLKEYLLTTADSISNKLSVDLGSVQGYVVNEPSIILVKIDKQGEIEEVKIATSCGAKEVDDVVLQSTKDILAEFVPAKFSIKDKNINLFLVVNF